MEGVYAYAYAFCIYFFEAVWCERIMYIVGQAMGGQTMLHPCRQFNSSLSLSRSSDNWEFSYVEPLGIYTCGLPIGLPAAETYNDKAYTFLVHRIVLLLIEQIKLTVIFFAKTFRFITLGSSRDLSMKKKKLLEIKNISHMSCVRPRC